MVASNSLRNGRGQDAFDGLLKEMTSGTGETSTLDSLDPPIRFATTCFKRGSQLEAWLYNVLLCYNIRGWCSFTLVFWDDGPDALTWSDTLCVALGPLIELGYVTMHLATGMAYWQAPVAKNTATRCDFMSTLANKNDAAFDSTVSLDRDNVLDLSGLEKPGSTSVVNGGTIPIRLASCASKGKTAASRAA